MGYRPVDRAQEFLLAPSMLDWLPEDHLVWLVIAAVERLDTAAFHGLARLGGVGRRGYDPDMLVTLFVYAMAHGVRSSRQIERLCGTDVAFRIVCAGDVPDHTVLARFRQRHEAALGDLLAQTLLLAAQLGMVRLGVVALDGTKVAANAARDANHTESHLRRLADQFLTEVKAGDECEDEAFGDDDRGDGVPRSVRDRTGRAERIDQALEQIKTRRAVAEQAQREQAERACQYVQALASPAVAWLGPPPRGTDPVAVAKARWDRARARRLAHIDAWHAKAAQASAQGRKLTGFAPVTVDDHCRVAPFYAAYQAAIANAGTKTEAEQQDHGQDHGQDRGQDRGQDHGQDRGQDKANLSDPQSRLMKTRNGWIQGYNCQAAVSEDEFIICARATQDTNDVAQFQPTIAAVAQAAKDMVTHTGRDDLTIGVVLADAGYDSDDNLTCAGPARVIADGKSRDLAKRVIDHPTEADPPADATPRQKMNHLLRTEQGHALYKRRGAMIEPANSWVKDGRGLRQFSRRGLNAAHSEFSFACAVTNLLKLATKGITTHHIHALPAPA